MLHVTSKTWRFFGQKEAGIASCKSPLCQVVIVSPRKYRVQWLKWLNFKIWTVIFHSGGNPPQPATAATPGDTKAWDASRMAPRIQKSQTTMVRRYRVGDAKASYLILLRRSSHRRRKDDQYSKCAAWSLHFGPSPFTPSESRQSEILWFFSLNVQIL